MAAWQFAIFEVYFHVGAAALPMLRQIAFGEYDWTQGNALEVLVRLAASGIERDTIVGEISREIPRLRFEALLYMAGPLLAQAKDNPEIASILRRFAHIPEWQEALADLDQS